MESIYQEIWNTDLLHNGLPALRPNETRNRDIGYVVVDESSDSVNGAHRVLKDVYIPNHKKTTYQLCEAMFDNYALERARGGISRPNEALEVLGFIDAILPTPVMQLCRTYLEQSLERRISNQSLATMIKQTWFHLGRAGSQTQASGFEHVFIGEQGSKSNQMSGYHFWYKYYLDDGGAGFESPDQTDRITYHGTRYNRAMEPDKGILIPEVVTLSLTVDASLGDVGNDPQGSRSRPLNKPVGGFFVGCSPECLVALGLIRCRTPSGKITKINGVEYQLDLHRLDGQPNSIRTFFPRFRRADFVDIQLPTENDGSSDQGNPLPDPVMDSSNNPEIPQAANKSPLRIIAAMVNPLNPEGGQEFVQIMNVGDKTATLEGWKIVAPNGTRFVLSDISIEPGDVFKFIFQRKQGVLRNKAGSIQLHNDQDVVVQLCSYSNEEASREGAPILFGL
ncbi:MAG: hypothetical protein GKR95_14275 [Gammaproteobacteria bacterium]|nr:hypothetical protein [Gammaproteobacteria bacterium]